MPKKLKNKINVQDIINVNMYDPFTLLGAHKVKLKGKSHVAVRVFMPDSLKISVLEIDFPKKKHEMKKLHDSGLFEVLIDKEEVFTYCLEIVWGSGTVETVRDPYSFLPVIGELDLHLFNEGTHHQIYDKLGSHLISTQGVEGVHFAVWAPNANRVSVVGDFNRWDGRRHPMRALGSSGVWELFIPDLKNGEKYKFEIKTKSDDLLIKMDPHSYHNEVRPNTASIVSDIDSYNWNDDEWMQKRRETNYFERPISIYEVHLGSWITNSDGENRFKNYREIAPLLVDHVKKMGYTHIELLPIQEHPLDGSWGYQVTGYFAVTSRFGTPEDFMYFVDYFHQNGIGIIMDWVPAHFPKDSHSLARFDGTCLYEHADPRKGEHTDWGTLIFNLGRNEVKSFLISNVLFWCKKYHIDGIRVDAVASMLYLDYSRKEGEWVPNIFGGREDLDAVGFLKRMNEVIHTEFPGILTIAEESTAWPSVSRPTYLGGLGFSLKWNMGWMNDMLEYISKNPIHRKFHHNNLTFSMLYAFSENFVLVLSHDEVVHGKGSLLNKMPGDDWQKFANLRLLLGYMYAHPGKKLLFMGGDIGQWDEWNDGKDLDWELLNYDRHRQFQKYVQDLNKLYGREKALWEIDFSWEGFEWIDSHDWEGSVVSFIRKSKDPSDYLVCIFNFTPVVREGYRVGVPESRFFKEIINSDSSIYHGSGLGNCGGLHSVDFSWQGHPSSLELTLPPLSVLFFKPA